MRLILICSAFYCLLFTVIFFNRTQLWTTGLQRQLQTEVAGIMVEDEHKCIVFSDTFSDECSIYLQETSSRILAARLETPSAPTILQATLSACNPRTAPCF